MPIRKFWVGEPAHRRGPCPMCRDMITTDAQYLGLPLLQSAVVTPEGNGLLRSTTGKVKDVKRQDDVFLATILVQTNITFADRGQGKIRSDLTDFCRHCCPFLQVVDQTPSRYLSIVHFVVPAMRIPVLSLPRSRGISREP